jgi:hypothetical protein
MKITQDVRDYAAAEEARALSLDPYPEPARSAVSKVEAGLAVKAEEFVEGGGKIYVDAAE